MQPSSVLSIVVRNEAGNINALIEDANFLDAHFSSPSPTQIRIRDLGEIQIQGHQITSSFSAPQFANISSLDGWEFYREQAIDAENPKFAFINKSDRQFYDSTLAGKVEKLIDPDYEIQKTAEFRIKAFKHNGKNYWLAVLHFKFMPKDFSGEIARYDNRGFTFIHAVLIKKPFFTWKKFTEASAESIFKSIYKVETTSELHDIVTKLAQATSVVKAKDSVDFIRQYFWNR